MAEILGTGSFVPANRVTNDDLAKTMDTSDEWIHSHTGIRSRHISSKEETNSFMATQAAKLALERSGVKPEEIDMIFMGTSTPDYNHFPSGACLVQGNLGCVNAGAVDLSAACTGFVYALETARCFIEAGQKKYILVIGVDRLSKATNWDDRKTAVLFGDGAGAVVVGPSRDGKSGVKNSILGADGTKSEAITYKYGGSNYHVKQDELSEEEYFIEMNGRAIYDFAVNINKELALDLMKNNGVTIDDVKYIVPHQANERILMASAKRGKIPWEKFYININEYANTSAATIPIALDELNTSGKIQKGDIIITVGFGGGLTFGGNYIVW